LKLSFKDGEVRGAVRARGSFRFSWKHFFIGGVGAGDLWNINQPVLGKSSGGFK
jgi:hypothetical protein